MSVLLSMGSALLTTKVQAATVSLTMTSAPSSIQVGATPLQVKYTLTNTSGIPLNLEHCNAWRYFEPNRSELALYGVSVSITNGAASATLSGIDLAGGSLIDIPIMAGWALGNNKEVPAGGSAYFTVNYRLAENAKVGDKLKVYLTCGLKNPADDSNLIGANSSQKLISVIAAPNTNTAEPTPTTTTQTPKSTTVKKTVQTTTETEVAGESFVTALPEIFIQENNETTVLSSLSEEALKSVENFTLDIPEFGKIVFNEPIDFTTDNIQSKLIKLDEYIKIEKSFLEINVSELAEFNKPAQITLRNQDLNTDNKIIILRDGEEVTDESVKDIQYDKETNMLSFSVVGFSKYEVDNSQPLTKIELSQPPTADNSLYRARIMILSGIVFIAVTVVGIYIYKNRQKKL